MNWGPLLEARISEMPCRENCCLQNSITDDDVIHSTLQLPKNQKNYQLKYSSLHYCTQQIDS